MSLTLNVTRKGVTEGENILNVGDVCVYLGHIPGGNVRVKLPNGDQDVAHPQCFAELRT